MLLTGGQSYTLHSQAAEGAICEIWSEGCRNNSFKQRVCVLCWRDVNDPARPVCNTTLYQQEVVFIEFQETQKNIP